MVIINTKPQIKKLLVLIVIAFILVATPMSGSANSTTPQKTKTSSAVKLIPDYIVKSAIKSSSQFDIPIENILGMIMVENNKFDPKLINYNSNGTHDIGICQINSSNVKSFKSAGFTDIYNVDQNIAFGTMKLKFAKDAYPNDWHKIYMVYNMGGSGAKKAIANGTTQTKYSVKVLNFVDNIDYYISDEMKNEIKNIKQSKKSNNINTSNKESDYPLFEGVTPPYNKVKSAKDKLIDLSTNKMIVPSERKAMEW